jgi:PAS domain S-box-containing protein
MRQDKTIIYIDSDWRHRQKAKNAFRKRNYNCILCKDGIDGIQRIEKENPDAVIVDYFLNDYKGDDLYTIYLTQMNNKKKKEVPFILLTTNGKVDKSKMYSLGFSACLGKPFRAAELREFVEDAIVSYQLKKEEEQFWKTIHQAKDFLERVIESSLDAIVTTDKRGLITFCNHACEDMIGYSFEDIIGKRVTEFLKGGSSELLKILNLLKKQSKIQNYKTEVILKDGKTIPINISISTMKNGHGKVMGVLGISKVIQGKNFNEFEKNESDRMATVVETSVAVNHAINNPLVPILGNAQFLLQDERIKNEEVRSRLRIIVKNALRIRDFTQKLARITHPVSKEYLRGTRMLDIEAST